ncbi:MAG: hypothetical protein ACT4P7_18165 [Gemmatimonadaceae bacterium]
MLPLGPVLDRLRARIPSLRRVEATRVSLEISLARPERPETSPARLLEPGSLRAHPIPIDGAPIVTAFLDGVQESREVAWVGTVPIVYGQVAAVVRERVNQRLETWRGAARRGAAMYAPWTRLTQRDRALFQEHGLRTRDVDVAADPNEWHPYIRMEEATNAVKQDREVLERDLAAEFCRVDAGTLYLDGAIPASDDVHRSERVVGVIKSHRTLYVGESDLPAVLSLAPGERSSVFAVERGQRSPVASWYLRLRDTGGRDPFWGLVRLEIPLRVFERGRGEAADERSAWVYAERAPLALPDGRWDTMAYGIRNCEEFLRAAL